MTSRIRRAWRGGKRARRGWWGNKPPAQRQIVIIGSLGSVLLFACGLFLDRNGLQLGTSFPSLTPFVWDLTKLAILGTLVVAIVDDIRSWGDRWQILQANAGSIATSVDQLLDHVCAVLNINGLGRGLGGVPALAAQRTAKFTRWFAEIDNRQYDFYFKQKGHNPLQSLEQLNECLTRVELPNVLPTVMTPSLAGRGQGQIRLNRSAMEIKAAQVVDRVQAARAGYSTGLNSQVDGLVDSLNALVEHTCAYEAVLVELANGEVRNGSKAPEYVPGCWTQFGTLSSFLEVLTEELETGRPHPYRSYRWTQPE